jgi:2-polyprenyl-3-methyl-5-hydroxy-6-metoxy-1,4-benzoquinol methylase
MATTASAAEAATAPSLTPDRIYQMLWAYVPPLVLEAAVRHRVFDVLDSGPMRLSAIAEATGASVRGLTAILNVLAGLGFLTKSGDEYALTPESAAFLVTTKPSFQGGLLRHVSQQLLPAWLHLNEVVATGKPATSVNRQQSGAEFFAEFVTDLLPMNYPAAQELARHLCLDRMDGDVSVLDLAAGSGVWGIALAQSSAKVRVRAVDWPQVIPVTRRTAERFGVGDRFSFAEGDLQEADFGSGHRVATLGHILHSEGEKRSRALLKKTFHALAPGGTITIAEFLVSADRSGPLNGLIFGVNMLVNTENGGTYSFEEIQEWLHEAGFVDARLLPAPGPSPLILAKKP